MDDMYKMITESTQRSMDAIKQLQDVIQFKKDAGERVIEDENNLRKLMNQVNKYRGALERRGYNLDTHGVDFGS